MKVLVINAGSSSIKYQLIDMTDETLLAKGQCDRIGIAGGNFKQTNFKGDTYKTEIDIPNHGEGIKLIVDALTCKEHGVIESMSEINAVGHRVVHGGEKFSGSVIITDEIIEALKECSELSPLHNPANLTGIRACEEIIGKIPQVGVFDTGFHQTMPDYAYIYPIPYEYYEKYKLRRYGFHGTSHRYVTARAAAMLGKKPEEINIVTCHLGNGSSITAVKGGKSFDTTMGVTPLDGLMMGTRSGSIDPAIIPFLMEKEHMSAKDIDIMLNKKSGMLGMTGISSDYRDVSAAAEAGNQDAINCLEAYAYRIIKYIGSYIAAMGGVDVITFTAGLGENAIPLRETICKAFEFMGLEFDSEANNCRGVEKIITKEGSKITACVIPTNEEIAICEETVELVKGK